MWSIKDLVNFTICAHMTTRIVNVLLTASCNFVVPIQFFLRTKHLHNHISNKFDPHVKLKFYKLLTQRKFE